MSECAYIANMLSFPGAPENWPFVRNGFCLRKAGQIDDTSRFKFRVFIRQKSNLDTPPTEKNIRLGKKLKGIHPSHPTCAQCSHCCPASHFISFPVDDLSLAWIQTLIGFNQKRRTRCVMQRLGSSNWPKCPGCESNGIFYNEISREAKTS